VHLGNGSTEEVPCSRCNGRSAKAGFSEVDLAGLAGYLIVLRLGPLGAATVQSRELRCVAARVGTASEYSRRYDHDLDCDLGIKRHSQGHGRARMDRPSRPSDNCQRAFSRPVEWLLNGPRWHDAAQEDFVDILAPAHDEELGSIQAFHDRLPGGIWAHHNKSLLRLEVCYPM
jgi:hypothetical protein